MTRRSWQVLQRGWLSANNTVLHGAPGEGAVLIDSGHVVHATLTAALVRHALGDEPLRLVFNTHLHSDHCGGNATLQRAFGAGVAVPAGSFDAVNAWDQAQLRHDDAGQRCERFSAQQALQAGEVLAVGGRRWDLVAAPGHDPQTLMAFDATEGVLLSADALWEDGFGVVFPELEDQQAFDAVAHTLDLIDQLAPHTVVPGHGRPFTDVAGALARARSRLHAFRTDPARHARHAAKALLKYHMMEVGEETADTARRWLVETPVMQACHRHSGVAASRHDWAADLIAQCCAQGLMQIDGDSLRDRPLPQ